MSTDTTIKDKITHTLEEIRVVMPGSQALLGFQPVALFSTGFESLSLALKEVHLVSLGLIALATLFLMAPSAYHRIACNGNNTPAVHRFASRMLIVAMLFLLGGLTADIFVATHLVLGASAAWIGGFACLLIGSVLWFLYPAFLARRS